MVTVQEIEQEQERLKGIKATTQKAVSEKLPVRRVGGADVRQKQQDVLKRRAAASKTVSQIETEEKRLVGLKQEVIDVQAGQRELSRQRQKAIVQRKFAGRAATRTDRLRELNQQESFFGNPITLLSGEQPDNLPRFDITRGDSSVDPTLQATQPSMSTTPELQAQQSLPSRTSEARSQQSLVFEKGFGARGTKPNQAGDKVLEITSGLQEAQRLDPVRVIDTRKGEVIVRGQKAFQPEAKEIVAQTFPEAREISTFELARGVVKREKNIGDLAFRVAERTVGRAIPKAQRKAGREESSLIDIQNREVVAFNKRIDALKIGETPKGIAIIPEDKIADVQITEGILTSRQRRLSILGLEREQRKITSRGAKLQTLSKSLEPQPKDLLNPATLLIRGGDKISEAISKGVEQISIRSQGITGTADSKITGRLSPVAAGKITRVGTQVGLFSIPIVGQAALGKEAIKGAATLFDPTKPFSERVISGGSGALAGTAVVGGGALRFRRFAKTEVRLGVKQAKQVNVATAAKVELQIGERIIPRDAFATASIKTKQIDFITTKGELLKLKIQGISPKQLKKFNEKELATLMKGRIDVTPAKAEVSVSSLLNVRGGKIVGDAFLFTRRGTSKRVGPVDVAILRGETSASQLVSRLNRKRLSPSNLKAFEDLEKIGILKGAAPKINLLSSKKTRVNLKSLEKILPEDVILKQAFGKKTRIAFGQIKTFKIGSITGKGFKLAKPGRRTNIASQVFVFKRVGKQKFDVVSGIKQRELFVERIASVDESLARSLTKSGKVRRPRRTDELKGTTEIIQIKVPDFTRLDKLGKTRTRGRRVSSKRLIQKQEQIFRLPLPKPIAKIPTTTTKLFKPGRTSARTSAIFRTPAALTTKTGLFTTQKVTPLTRQRQASTIITSQKVVPISATVLKNILKTSTKQIPRLSTKQSTRQVTKQLDRQIGKQLSKQLTKQTTKQTTKQITKLISGTGRTIRGGRVTKTTRPFRPFLLGFKPKTPQFRTPRRKKRKRSDASFLVEGFSAKALNLKPIKIKRKDLAKFAGRFQTIGLRRKPIII